MIYLACFLFSLTFTFIASRWGKKDIPTARSSHIQPTSRLGGVVIMTSLGLGGYWEPQAIPHSGMLIGSLAFGLLGMWDDFKPLTPKLRLGLQAILAVGITWNLLQMEGEAFFNHPLSILHFFLIALWMVAFVNIFNFMDGLNGMAGFTTLVYGIFFALWLPEYREMMLYLIVSIGGFLIFNGRGKIFLGDGGSYYLGALLASLPFTPSAIDQEGWIALFLLVPLLFGVYIFDTGFTLLKRLYENKNILASHNEHLYQRLHQKGWSHLSVSLSYAFLQILCVGSVLYFYHPLILYPLWLAVFSFLALWVFKKTPRSL